LTLERPGPWGLEIVVRRANGAVEAARLSVNALAQPRSPMPGTPAPRSRNLVAGDVSDLRQIDSSEPPDGRLHQTVIADAIRDGRPQVIVFATPKYCTSRVCGPVLDVVRTLIPAYGRRVAFVHQEIWQPGGMQKLTPTVEEWNLRSEPWTFVVDGDGPGPPGLRLHTALPAHATRRNSPVHGTVSAGAGWRLARHPATRGWVWSARATRSLGGCARAPRPRARGFRCARASRWR